MFARVRRGVAHCALIAQWALLALCFAPAPVVAQPPAAHHPGTWTTAAPWPGRADFAHSIWAMHMAVVQGDTLFSRPHSQVLAWGPGSASAVGSGVWAWNPNTDAATSAAANLNEVPIERPTLETFCAGHCSLPNGDLLVVSGTERVIVGQK